MPPGGWLQYCHKSRLLHVSGQDMNQTRNIVVSRQIWFHCLIYSPIKPPVIFPKLVSPSSFTTFHLPGNFVTLLLVFGLQQDNRSTWELFLFCFFCLVNKSKADVCAPLKAQLVAWRHCTLPRQLSVCGAYTTPAWSLMDFSQSDCSVGHLRKVVSFNRSFLVGCCLDWEQDL